MSDSVPRDEYRDTVGKIDSRLRRLEVLVAVVMALSVWQVFGPATLNPSNAVPSVAAAIERVL